MHLIPMSEKIKSLSLRTKLRKASVINAVVILMTCWFLLFSTAMFFIKHYERRNIDLIATTLSSSLTASTVFEDSYNANKKISKLGQKGMFNYAALYTYGGKLIAEWNVIDTHISVPRRILRNWLFPKQIKIKISHGSRTVGWLFIEGNDVSVVNFIRYSLLILTIGMVFIFVISFVVSSLMYRRIINNLTNITTSINNIIYTKDFSKRLSSNPIKEFQYFSTNVNSLISEIERLNGKLVIENKSLAIKAYRDELTGLDNRAAFLNHLHFMLSEDGPSASFCVLFMDGNGFKLINDTWGHAAGDAVLQAIGSRLKNITHPHDYVARMGGDEFSMILANHNTHDIENFIQQIHQQFESPILINKEIAVNFSMTVGFTLAYKEEDISDVLVRADTHMYQLKKV